MLSLRTLGSVDLRGPSGEERLGGAGQSKRLALLVFLAVDDQGGFHRRDTLVALFWPDLDQAHARAALRKALHHLRMALGPGLVVTRTDEEVRLDPAALSCDAREFKRLAAAGSHAEALQLYTGEFLRGLHTSDAAEFERWLDAERHQLAATATACALDLAASCRAAKQPFEAAQWARRASEIAPLEERPNRILIELLAEAGDRPAALSAYQRFTERLALDLDLAPSVETRRIADRLRSQPLPATREKAGATAVCTAPDDATEAADVSAGRFGGRPNRIRTFLIAGGVAVAGVLLLGLWGPLRPRVGAGPTASQEPPWVLVADFDGPPDDPTLALAIRGLVSSALEESGRATAVPADQLQQARRQALVPDTTRLTPSVARHLAYRAAVSMLVEGAVTRIGERDYGLVLRLLAVEDGRVLKSVSGTASGGAIMTKTGKLAGTLMADLRESQGGAPGDSREPALTPSFEAYRKFVEARQHNSSGDMPGAVRLAREALAIDTGFAAAWHVLGHAYGNLGMMDSSYRASREAVGRTSRLSTSQRLLAESRLMSRHADRIRMLDQLIQLSPRDPGALTSRGLALEYLGRYDEALESFEKARAVGPFEAPPLIRSNHALLLAALGRAQEARPVVEGLSGDPQASLAMHLAIATADWETVDSVATARLRNPSNPPATRIIASIALASAQAARGRLRTAVRSLDEADSAFAQEQLESHSPLYPRLLLAVASERPVRGRMPPVPGDTSIDNAIVHGHWAALLGDMRAAEAARDLARARGIDAGYGSWRDLQGLEALLARSRDDWSGVVHTLAGVARAGGGMQGGRVYGGGILLRRWMVADAYERLGQLDSAAIFFEMIATSQRLSPREHQPKGLAASFALRRLARLHSRLGNRSLARSYWSAFLRAFSDPDPDVSWMVKEAREELTKLAGPGAER